MSKSKGFNKAKFSLAYLKDSPRRCDIVPCAFMAQVYIFGVINEFYLCKSHLAEVLSEYETIELLEEDDSFIKWGHQKLQQLKDLKEGIY